MGEGEGRMNWESSMETFTLPYVKQTVRICCVTQGTQTQCYVTTKRGRMRGEVGGKFKREGTYEYLRLIHVDVWQKSTQYCKAIVLQLKINKYFKKKKRNTCVWDSCPAVQDSALPTQGFWVQPLGRELRAHILQRDQQQQQWKE